MALYAVRMQPANGQIFPEDIYKKARDMHYLFRSEVEWYFEPDRIGFVYTGGFYDIHRNLAGEMKKKHITRNMVEFYQWAREKAHIYTDCHNVCDFEYGPRNMEELDQRVERALKDAKDWKEPADSIRDIYKMAGFVQLDPEAHVIHIEVAGLCLVEEVPEDVLYLKSASILYGVIEYCYGKECGYIYLTECPEVLRMQEGERQEFIEFLLEAEPAGLMVDHYRDAEFLNHRYTYHRT